LLGGEDAVLLVDRDSHQRLELARQLSVSGADVRQQLPVPIEDLKPVFHLVGYPNVPIAIDSDALGPGKVSGTIAVFAENADEIPVGVKNLDPIVESIG